MITLLLALGWFLGAAGAWAPEPSGAQQQAVRVEDGLLSVELESAPAQEVFRAIAEQGGFEVRLDRSLLRRLLTARFERLPLDKGLERLIGLLQTDNYWIEFLGDRVERVEVLAATGLREVQDFRPAPVAKPSEAAPIGREEVGSQTPGEITKEAEDSKKEGEEPKKEPKKEAKKEAKKESKKKRK